MNQKLKSHRVLKKMTQENMAKIIGITNKSYCEKETGKREFTRTELKKIITALELTPQDTYNIFFSEWLTFCISK